MELARSVVNGNLDPSCALHDKLKKGCGMVPLVGVQWFTWDWSTMTRHQNVKFVVGATRFKRLWLESVYCSSWSTYRAGILPVEEHILPIRGQGYYYQLAGLSTIKIKKGINFMTGSQDGGGSVWWPCLLAGSGGMAVPPQKKK